MTAQIFYQLKKQMKTLSQDTFIFFVDPSAGYKGAHNTGVLDLLTTYMPDDAQGFNTQLGAAVNKRISAQWCEKLDAAGVHVLPAFELDGYQLSGKMPEQDQITPYVATLGAEFATLFEALRRRWPTGEIHLVYHTMSWEHVMALASALRGSRVGQTMVHHVFLMYWPGVDEEGKTTNAELKIRYKIALSNFRGNRSGRLYTSTVEYKNAYQSLIGDDLHFSLHPSFLDDWHRPASVEKPFEPKSIRKILAYSGDVRAAKGFDELPALIDALLQTFPEAEELTVHLTSRSDEVAKPFRATYQTILGKAKRDRRIKMIHKFISTEEMNKLIESVDLMALNYQSDFYKNKTSGFLWLAARLGTACIVPANTWMAREAQRLGVDSFTFEDAKLMPNAEKQSAWSRQEATDYRQSILQAFGPWLEKTTREAGLLSSQ